MCYKGIKKRRVSKSGQERSDSPGFGAGCIGWFLQSLEGRKPDRVDDEHLPVRCLPFKQHAEWSLSGEAS